jgi:hypothetical protein
MLFFLSIAAAPQVSRRPLSRQRDRRDGEERCRKDGRFDVTLKPEATFSGETLPTHADDRRDASRSTRRMLIAIPLEPKYAVSLSMPSKSAFEPTLPRFWGVADRRRRIRVDHRQRTAALVASHFGSGGQADGFMARGDYLTFMLIGAVAIPVLSRDTAADSSRRSRRG